MSYIPSDVKVFNRSRMYPTINNFIRQYENKNKIAIPHQDLELLPLIMKSNHTEEYVALKSRDSEFFRHLLLYIKTELENRSGKMLFLTLREGNYVILDSWHIKESDWAIEERNRGPEFMRLKEAYYLGREKLRGIKSLEDFVAVVQALNEEELENIFGAEIHEFLVRIIPEIKNL